MSDLDAQHYAHNSQQQLSLAQLALGSLQFKGDEAVLDVGCGEGKITAQIAAEVPQGKVVGIDKSPSMIALAQKLHPSQDFPNLAFEVQNAEELSFTTPFDLMISFSCLHWVKNKEITLKKMQQLLKPKGIILIVTYPKSPFFWDPIETVVQHPKWASYFRADPQPYSFLDQKQYIELIEKIGLHIVESFEVHPHRIEFAGREGFINYTKGWLPYLLQLPLENHEELLEEIGDHAVQLNHLTPNNQLIYNGETYLITLRKEKSSSINSTS